MNYFREERKIPDPDPRHLFDEDLCKELDTWVTIGDKVVIGLDMNDDS